MTRTRSRNRGALPIVAASLALAIACVTFSPPAQAPAAKHPHPRGGKTRLLTSWLSPVGNATESGIASLRAPRRGPVSISAVLTGIAVDPSDPSGNTVYLGLARNGCDTVTSVPSSADLVRYGRGLPFVLINLGVTSGGNASVTDLIIDPIIWPRGIRQARSFVLFGGPARARTLRACGGIDVWEHAHW